MCVARVSSGTFRYVKSTRHFVAGIALAALALAPTALATTAQVQDWGLATDPLATNGRLVNVLTAPGQAPSLVRIPVNRRIAILYDTDEGVAATLGPSVTMRFLPWIFRQEPSSSEVSAALADNSSQRITKVSADDLAREPSATAMADTLRAAVDKKCTTPAGFNTCGAHMASLDELTQTYAQPPWSTRPDPANPGVRLAVAMRMLQRIPSPWGGSYASRIHIYVAPGMSTSIAAGRGPFRTKGRDGKNHFRNYSWAMQALSRGADTWLEMYHFRNTATKTAFTPREWRDVPTAMATFMRERSPKTNPLNKLHFMVAGVGPTEGCAVLLPGVDTNITRTARAAITVIPTPEPVVVIPDSGSPMSCLWKRMQAGPVNQRITANGVGTHRVSGDVATEFGDLWRQFYVMP